VQSLFARAIGSRLSPNHWTRAIVGRNELRLGNAARARELLDDLAANDFAGIARGIRWIGTLVETAHLCADLEDGDRAEALCRLLSTAEEQHGVLPVPIIYGGPAHYCLARLHAVLGRPKRASEHYELALARATAMRAEPMRAQIALDFAGLLRRLGQSSRAGEREREARTLAETIGTCLG
jgi:hypothetical protein